MTQQEMYDAASALQKKIEAKEEVIKTVREHLNMLCSELAALDSERFTVVGKFMDDIRRELNLNSITYF